MSTQIITRQAQPADAAAISRLHELTLGPGRFARTAYRIREGTPAVTPYCRVAMLAGRMVAALRMTEITIGGAKGALLLGPLAVDPEFAGRGYGRRLIMESLEQARNAGIRLVVLVGDEPYYGRFGFKPVAPGHIALPGPVNPQRLLACELRDGAMADLKGAIAAVR
jgi:predicted N-acetyltransferase YhbS